MNDDQDDVLSRDDVSLVGSWQVEDIGGAGVLDGAPPRVDFGADGRLAASANLNRILGQYEIVDGRLRCSPLASTRMAGPEAVMRQEQRLIDALSTPGRIVVQGPFVTIGTGPTSLRLIRADAPPAEQPSGRSPAP